MYLNQTATETTTMKGGLSCASSPSIHGTDIITSSDEDVTEIPNSSITPPRVAEFIRNGERNQDTQSLED